MHRTAFTLLLCMSLSCFAQDSPQQRMRKAIEAQQAGRFDEAIRDYRMLLQQYPNLFAIRSNLGAALAAEGQYAAAIAEYRKALAIQPDPAVRLNLALAHYKSGDYEKAAEQLAQVHAEQPANMQAVELLADCDLRLGQNRRVIALLTPVQSLHPDNQATTYLLATALVRDGQAAQGQKLIDGILRNGDTAQSRMLMGTTKYVGGDYAGARADLLAALQLDPNLPGAYTYYGKALLASGDRAGGEKAFQHALQLDANDFMANLDMGILLRDKHDDAGAMKYFAHALQVHPGDPGVRFEIASTELTEGRLSVAAQDLESLVKAAPDFAEAHVLLATVYFREKRKADGERERAIYMKLNAERQAREEVAAKRTP